MMLVGAIGRNVEVAHRSEVSAGNCPKVLHQLVGAKIDVNRAADMRIIVEKGEVSYGLRSAETAGKVVQIAVDKVKIAGLVLL